VSPCFRSELFFDDADLCFRVLRQWKLGFVHQVLAFIREDNDGAFAAFSNFDYDPAYRYLLTMAYGAEIFNGQEWQQVKQQRKSLYYRRLGRALVHGKSKRYWDFHRKAGRVMGYELRYSALIWPAILAGLSIVCNPKATLTRIIRQTNRWRKRGPRRRESARNRAWAPEEETYGWDM
ncbi:MAG: hypothetical protein JO271_12745, partial [Verrucomicrobia bacterium]|nr:hypothetical protein [Verrucomicrobiota bacterium]